MIDDKTLVGNGPAHRPPEEIPTRLGKYEIRGELGRGSCGIVYRGYDPFVQRHVAIKVADSSAGLHADTTAPHRNFFAEARAAGMLQHPHIVSLFDAGVEGRHNYLVMEYVDGETLLPLCHKKGPRAPLEQVIDIAFKCSKALDYSHEKGVLHRDIKPSNIMLTRNGIPKIMDFSIAEINTEPIDDGSIVGSPLYMSPEQVLRQPMTSHSDLYALGAVMYHLLVGEPPFMADDVPKLFDAILNDTPKRVDEIRPEIPSTLADVVARLLEKSPVDRFPSGKRLSASLSQLFDRLRLSENQISRREQGDSLRRLHFFDSFSDAEIDEVLNASTMCTFDEGATIVEEGEMDTAFFIIVLGRAEVRKGERHLQTFNKGDCFGEIGLLSALKRTTSVVAATKVLALKVHDTLLEQASMQCQLRFYKTFTETLIYRLSLASVKLSSVQGGGTG
jgi:eukaryotic-like serine/threonine-protein kinase